jgi:hypothetical protein
MVSATYRTVPVSGAPKVLASVKTASKFVPGSDMMLMAGPFEPRVLNDVSDAGDVVHVDAAPYDVQVFPSSGAPWRLQVSLPPRKVSAADRDSATKAALTRFRVQRVADLPAPVREQYEKMPSEHPSLAAVHVFADGTIWIRPTVAAGATNARWDLFRRDGARIGQVTLPVAARVWDGGRDWVIVDVPNEDDVSSFVRYMVGG